MLLQAFEHDTIADLRLARPPVNALNPALVQALNAAIHAATERGAEAVIVSGSPGVFTAGLDLPELIALDRSDMRAAWTDLYSLMATMARCPVPLIAAITGYSMAGGAVLALFADLRIMAAGDFKIGLNEVAVGIELPRVIYRALRRLVGARHADRMGISGALLNGQEALAVGLVDELCEPEVVVARAIDRTRALLSLPRYAMQRTRAMARSDLVALFEEDADTVIESVLDGWFSEATQQALHNVVASLRKRK